MLIITSIFISILIVCFKTFKLQRYWKNRQVRYVKPWPFFGYMAPNIFRLKSFAEIVQGLYNTFPEQRYFGCYQFSTPILMIRDPDLIKQVMVNNFKAFPQHKNCVDVNADPIWAKNLFAMEGGEEWHKIRSMMSCMFTSSKLKVTFEFMKECAKTVIEHYRNGSEVVEVNVKDVASRFANDVIASAVFGINCNSMENPDNEFYQMTKEVTNVSFTRMLKFFVYTILPSLAKFLHFRIIEKRHRDFYENIIKETIKERTQNGIIRPDMIHLLVQARNNGFDSEKSTCKDCGVASGEFEEPLQTNEKHTEITDEDIATQSIIFFFAGFDTVSTAISHLIYELALNSEIQRKLREEIDNTKNEFTYEQLLGMKYLDMVVSETLRKWPSNAINDRECVETFTIQPERVWEKSLDVEPKTLCAFPIFALHRDPKLYANPSKFDPERFSDENKIKITPFTYLPFGAGPRNCIGSHFAVMEIKTFVYFIISAFEIVRTDKTKDDVPISKTAINLEFENGFWIGLKPRRR